jgi:hypothetical protein
MVAVNFVPLGDVCLYQAVLGCSFSSIELESGRSPANRANATRDNAPSDSTVKVIGLD